MKNTESDKISNLEIRMSLSNRHQKEQRKDTEDDVDEDVDIGSIDTITLASGNYFTKIIPKRS